MKVAWIYPFDPKNGISFYARSFADALAPFCEIESFDSAACAADRKLFARINRCDLAHLQYEISLYDCNGSNRFERVCRAIGRPKIVTHHEVYREFPGVFPREKIRGRGIVRILKELIYDVRHPAITAYRRHLKHRFWAATQIVHYTYQKGIMRELGVDETTVEVVGHPVARLQVARHPFSGIDTKTDQIHLGSSGFINRNYDYEQLFATLDLLRLPWRFTWIGGLRQPEHEGLLAALRERIVRRGWERRFTITGWVDEGSLQQRLSELDVYLALFSNRSTSSTLMKALGALRCIVARDLPLTRELNCGEPAMLLTGNNPADAAACIEALARQPRLRERLLAGVERYVAGHSYGEMAKKTAALYERVIVRAGR
jgi:glycosyltransferase involved in cell wall biosynthesis